MEEDTHTTTAPKSAHSSTENKNPKISKVKHINHQKHGQKDKKDHSKFTHLREQQTPLTSLTHSTLPTPSTPSTLLYIPGPVIASITLATLASIVLYRTSRIRLMEGVVRWFPMAYISIWGVALLISALFIAQTVAPIWLWLNFGVLVLAALINLSWLKSVLAGVVLSFDTNLSRGDLVRVGEVQGEILEFGLRSVLVRSEEGIKHQIPNVEFIQDSVTNLSSDGGDAICVLGVDIPTGLSTDEAMKLAMEAAILSPLSSPRHKPHVFLKSSHAQNQNATLQVHIRGYAYDSAHQEHFKSDVLTRLLRAFHKHTDMQTREMQTRDTQTLDM